MTIRKGEPWGEPAVCPPDVAVMANDRQLRGHLVAARTRELPASAIGVAGGDLARTCGGGLGRRPCAARVTVDAMRLTLDGVPTWGVAHVIAHRGWWRGDVTMIMNAEYFGVYDVVPRSHPNDGKLEVLQVDPAMPVRQRWQARKRARTGTHLPHRHLSVRSITDFDLNFRQPMIVWVDGVRYGAVRDLSVSVEPDALTIYV
jgi:hypothetical protein